MTSITGSTPPLHRKFDERQALQEIRGRYSELRKVITAQVQALQADDDFIAAAQTFYAAGYKDWHILSAVANLMINRRIRELGLDLETRHGQEQSKDVGRSLTGVVYPAKAFIGKELSLAFQGHALTCMRRYGFESRGIGMNAFVVEKFLRERMRHFELDIPHAPMFGRPPNDWPVI